MIPWNCSSLILPNTRDLGSSQDASSSASSSAPSIYRKSEGQKDLHMRLLTLKHGFRIHMADISPLCTSNLVVLYIYCFQGAVTHSYSGDIHSFNNSTLIKDPAFAFYISRLSTTRWHSLPYILANLPRTYSHLIPISTVEHVIGLSQ